MNPNNCLCLKCRHMHCELSYSDATPGGTLHINSYIDKGVCPYSFGVATVTLGCPHFAQITLKDISCIGCQKFNGEVKRNGHNYILIVDVEKGVCAHSFSVRTKALGCNHRVEKEVSE